MRNIELSQTCGACPEQYDAFVGNDQVGYLRLRHGYFTVSCPECMGEIVYESETIGDGIFDPDEREKHLKLAIDAINRWLDDNATPSP